jgi:hypothetical protein
MRNPTSTRRMQCAVCCPQAGYRAGKLRIAIDLVHLFNAADSDMDYSLAGIDDASTRIPRGRARLL